MVASGKLKVLLCGSSYNIGLTYYLALYAIGVKDLGHDVFVLSSRGEQNPGLLEDLRANGIVTMESDFLDGRNVAAFHLAAKEISHIIKQKKINVIHSNGFFQCAKAYLGVRYSKSFRKIGITVMVHSIRHGTKFEKITCIAGSRLINLCADIAMPVSEWEKKKLLDNGVHPDKLTTVHNAINFNKFDNEMLSKDYIETGIFDSRFFGSPVVVYLANLNQVKAVDCLLRAAPIVIKEYPETKFLILGDGPLKEELLGLANFLGIAENVFFPGRLPREYIPGILSSCDIGVVTSTAETFGHNIVEPMAASKPVISTPVGVAREIINEGRTGFIVPVGDYCSTARRIKQLLSNEHEAEKIGIASRECVRETFNINRIAKKIEGTYYLALKQKEDKG